MTSSNHLILCRPLLLPPSILLSIRVFSNESALPIRWPKYYWRFSFSISPCNEYSGLISLGLTVLISLQSKGFSRVFCNTRVRKHPFFGAQSAEANRGQFAFRRVILSLLMFNVHKHLFQTRSPFYSCSVFSLFFIPYYFPQTSQLI